MPDFVSEYGPVDGTVTDWVGRADEVIPVRSDAALIAELRELDAHLEEAAGWSSPVALRDALLGAHGSLSTLLDEYEATKAREVEWSPKALSELGAADPEAGQVWQHRRDSWRKRYVLAGADINGYVSVRSRPHGPTQAVALYTLRRDYEPSGERFST